MSRAESGFRGKALWPLLAVLIALAALSLPSLRVTLDLGAGVSTERINADAVELAISVVLAIVACATLIGGRFAPLSFALFLFALSRAAQPAGILAAVLPDRWKWLGYSVAALVAGASVYGFVALCMRMPGGKAVGRWRSLDRLLPFYSLLVAGVYAGSLMPAPMRPLGVHPYVVFGALIWVAYLCGLLAYLDGRRTATGEELLRTRWVAVAIAAHVGIEATFLILNMRDQPLLAGYLFAFNPAPYAFAYALVRGRIVDVRVVGGRALVYAALTSVPIAALAVVDWLFAKELENVKLAGVAEVAIAVAFSFWLQSLHRQIDRFVDRTLFAERHRAHAAVEEMIAALPFVERTETIETMLVTDACFFIVFLSSEIYTRADDGFERTASVGCEGLAPRIDSDDPLVLYPRSTRRLVALCEVPASRLTLPSGDSAPAFALPVIGGTRTYAIVLYGEHRSGEPMDADEERLLLRLAHGAANAYEHLLLVEQEREIATLRSCARMEAKTPPSATQP